MCTCILKPGVYQTCYVHSLQASAQGSLVCLAPPGQIHVYTCTCTCPTMTRFFNVNCTWYMVCAILMYMLSSGHEVHVHCICTVYSQVVSSQEMIVRLEQVSLIIIMERGCEWFYRITKNFREKKFHKGHSANRHVYITGNFTKKLSQYCKIREIREGFLSQKFLVIRYVHMCTMLQEKEQSKLDLQLLDIKYEKEKRVNVNVLQVFTCVFVH